MAKDSKESNEDNNNTISRKEFIEFKNNMEKLIEESKKESKNIISNISNNLTKLIKIIKRNKTDISNKIKYFEINEGDNIIYKYNLNKYNNKTLKASYYYVDTSFEDRLSAQYKIDINNNNNQLVIENYEKTINHSNENNSHNYVRKYEILNDLKYNTIYNINKKCENPIYLKKFMIEYCLEILFY